MVLHGSGRQEFFVQKFGSNGEDSKHFDYYGFPFKTQI